MNPSGGLRAEHAAYLRALLDAINQILARHFVIDAERRPAQRPIRLPLHFHAPAGYQCFDLLSVLVLEDDCSFGDIALKRWDLQHPSALGADGQERRICRAAILAERRQHDRHDLFVAFEHHEQRLIERTAAILLRRREELVLETERIQEAVQHRIVVRCETLIRPERIRYARQRPAKMFAQHRSVRHIGWNFAHAVHVVAEGDEARRDRVVREDAEGVAHHARARHLAECPDVRQTRRPIACLENRGAVLRRALQPLDDQTRLFERPSLGDGCESGQFGHGRSQPPPA